MTEQLIRDRLADTEKWLERFSHLTVELAMLKVAVREAVSKGHLSDELLRLVDRVREEQERAVQEAKTEMQAAFEKAIDGAFARHAESQQKTIRLYTRIGVGLIVVLIAKDAGSIFTAGRMILGMP